jgi:hypothetical protein
MVETDPLLGCFDVRSARVLAHASRAVSVRPAMSNYDSSALQTADTDDAQPSTDPRPDYFELGIDARGARHVCDTATSTVHIIHSDGSRGRRHLDGGTLDDYMSAVAGAYGWDVEKYGASLVEMLADAVEEGADA